MAIVGGGDPIDASLLEFCNHIRTTVVPQNEGVDWDCIRVELWPDSGRIIAFPSNSRRSERIERAGCQVVFEDLLAAYEEIADLELDDHAFSLAVMTLEREWIERFIVAAQNSGLSDERIQFWDGDGDSPIRAEME